MFSFVFLALAMCVFTEKDICKQKRSTKPTERWKCFRHGRQGEARAGGSRGRRRGGGKTKEDCQVIKDCSQTFFYWMEAVTHASVDISERPI